MLDARLLEYEVTHRIDSREKGLLLWINLNAEAEARNTFALAQSHSMG